MNTKSRPAIGLIAWATVIMVAVPLAAEEPSVRELLDSIKPEGAPNAQATPSSYSTPKPVRSARPRGLVARVPSASELWNVPMPQAQRQSRDFDTQLWAPDPNVSAAYRKAAGSTSAATTVDALRRVSYPQHVAQPTAIPSDRSLDWQAQRAPDSARYFNALRQAKRNATEPKSETRVGRAQAHVNYGFDLANRGAAHSAQQEFTEALWAVAHANDARTGTRQHADHVRRALKALDEAEEFSPLVRSEESCLEAGRIAAHHKTDVAKRVVKQRLDAISAMQVYMNYAQQHLIQAIDGDGAGAEALYGLSRSLRTKFHNGTSGGNLAGAKAMALLLAAHQIQPANHKVTNELGVLYARFGELQKAELMLKRSLVSRERAESWHNLSKVWDMAGKDELSLYAQRRSGQLKEAGASSIASRVRFVTAEQFAATSTGVPEFAMSEVKKPQVAAAPPAPATDGKGPSWIQRVLATSPLNSGKSKETTHQVR